jgi:HemY protein
MRAVIWLVLLFVAAVVAASTLGRNDGLVTFYWGGWRLDVSLNLFVIGLLATCFVLMSAFKAVNALVTLPVRAREWRVRRREQASQAALREALAEYFGARYTRAQRAAQRALSIQENTPELVPDADLRVLAHLLAAASLHRLQDRVGRDDQMKRLRKLSRRGAADDGAQLMAAEWAIDDRDASRALDLLSALAPGVARRTHALRLRLQAARLARQPLEALRTARLLAKHQAFSPVAAQSLLRSLAFEAIDSAHDIDQLKRVWQQLDAPDRRDPYIVARAALRAARLDKPEEGRAWLKPLWDRIGELSADERAQVALALLDTLPSLGADWLPRLEAALNTFSHESAVALAVGAAFAERQLWGKARRPLEQAAASQALSPAVRRRAWRLLADLAREEADNARAMACEQAAAKLD